MGKEFEAKFLNVDVPHMRKLLKKIGAKKVHDNIKIIRAVYDLCNSNVKGFARVRDEGKGVTMTSKVFNNQNYPDEYEVAIANDFKSGDSFLQSLNLKKTSYQESYREKWSHPNAHEITFDTIPGIPTYMEIDCDSEKKLNDMISKLQLDTTQKRFGAFDKTYHEYYGISPDIINHKTPYLTFQNIHNEIKPKKNIQLFRKITKLHKTL